MPRGIFIRISLGLIASTAIGLCFAGTVSAATDLPSPGNVAVPLPVPLGGPVDASCLYFLSGPWSLDVSNLGHGDATGWAALWTPYSVGTCAAPPGTPSLVPNNPVQNVRVISGQNADVTYTNPLTGTHCAHFRSSAVIVGGVPTAAASVTC